MKWIRDRALGLVLFGLFAASWVGQAFAQAADWIDEQRDHDSLEGADVWEAFRDADFWEDFWRATLENWQSEFLQLFSFVVLTAYLVYKKSAESKDSSERMEAKLDAIAEHVGLDPKAIEASLPERYQKEVS